MSYILVITSILFLGKAIFGIFDDLKTVEIFWKIKIIVTQFNTKKNNILN
jgi:hypothetical protein